MADASPPAPGAGPSPDPPPTPDGYDEPYLFEYSTVVLLLLSLPMFLLSAFGFGRLLWALQGPAVFGAVFDVTESGAAVTITLDLAKVAGPFLVALVVTVVVHELVHGAVMRRYGYDVTYGVNPAMGAFYVSAFGQFQRREELFPVGLAPLVGISVVAAPLLAVPVPVVALTAYLVAVVNATGAVGDLYLVWRLWRMPEGTLMYDADLRHWYVFEPTETDGEGGAESTTA